MMKNYSKDELRAQKRYLELLSNTYPTITKTIEEIVNMEALLNLPKGTEHFLSDIHGEYPAFNNILQNGSGAVRKKVMEALENSTTLNDLDDLSILIQYPSEKLELLTNKIPEKYLENWYNLTIYRLIKVARECATKYTSQKVHDTLPEDYGEIIEELLRVDETRTDKKFYYNAIIDSIVQSGKVNDFIIELSEFIKRLVIDQLHILGDIYDRGAEPHLIMDKLMDHHSIDIQWGNHDILWMGAAAGNPGSITNALRIALKYGNMDVLETGYGINLLPLANFANEYYSDTDLEIFKPKNAGEDWKNDPDLLLLAKMHKAITILQLKIEDQIIENNPYYNMKDRQVLRNLDLEKGTYNVDGKEYKLKDSSFPTINPEKPLELTPEEQSIIDQLVLAFKKSEKLQKHVRFLFNKGSMYLTQNNNLLFHAAQLLDNEGNFIKKKVGSREYRGKALVDKYDQKAREAFFSSDPTKYSPITDFLWFLWLHPDSPLFGKDKMATFERYFIDDKDLQKENYNAYYELMKDPEKGEEIANKILIEYGIDPEKGHIINGHVPVKVKKGEKPIHAGGKQLIIDGGFSRAYQDTTGLAGYTLTYNSYGLSLTSHKPFSSVEDALKEETSDKEKKEIVESLVDRITIRDTDKGKEVSQKLEDLNMLLSAYKQGIIKEKSM